MATIYEVWEDDQDIFEGTEDECIDYIITIAKDEEDQKRFKVIDTKVDIEAPRFKIGDRIIHPSIMDCPVRVITSVYQIGKYDWKYEDNEGGKEYYSGNSSTPFLEGWELVKDKPMDDSFEFVQVQRFIKLVVPKAEFDKDFVNKIQGIGYQVTFVCPLDLVTRYTLFVQDINFRTQARVMICGDLKSERDDPNFPKNITIIDNKEDFLIRAFELLRKG